MELRSSHLQGQRLTNEAIFPIPLAILNSTDIEYLYSFLKEFKP